MFVDILYHFFSVSIGEKIKQITSPAFNVICFPVMALLVEFYSLIITVALNDNMLQKELHLL